MTCAKTPVVVFAALVLLCVVLLAHALVRGRADVALTALPSALFLGWLWLRGVRLALAS